MTYGVARSWRHTSVQSGLVQWIPQCAGWSPSRFSNVCTVALVPSQSTVDQRWS